MKLVAAGDEVKQVSFGGPHGRTITAFSIGNGNPFLLISAGSVAERANGDARLAATHPGIKRNPTPVRRNLTAMQVPFRMAQQGGLFPALCIQKKKRDRLARPSDDLTAVRSPAK